MARRGPGRSSASSTSRLDVHGPRGFPRIPAAAGRSGASAVHVRIDRLTQRRDGDAREHQQQFGKPAARVPPRTRQRVGELAAGISRHGPHRRRRAAALHRVSRVPDGAVVLHCATGDVARRDHPLSRHAQRRSQLRLRRLCAGRDRRADARPGSRQLGKRLQRCGARAARNARGVPTEVRALRLSAETVFPVLRPGGEHADRDRPGRRPRADVPARPRLHLDGGGLRDARSTRRAC